jgi:hypothetical protein
MEERKHNLKQFNNASNGQRFVLVDPLSIALIEQISDGVVRITMKEVRDGQNISFTANYDLQTIYSIINSRCYP